MNAADVSVECVLLVDLAQQLGRWAAGKEPPTDFILATPPRWQDLAKQMDPAWGLAPAETLMVAAGAWAQRLTDADRHDLIVVCSACRAWSETLWEYYRKFGQELESAGPDTAEQLDIGLHAQALVSDRLGWIGWATSTLARRMTTAQLRSL